MANQRIRFPLVSELNLEAASGITSENRLIHPSPVRMTQEQSYVWFTFRARSAHSDFVENWQDTWSFRNPRLLHDRNLDGHLGLGLQHGGPASVSAGPSADQQEAGGDSGPERQTDAAGSGRPNSADGPRREFGRRATTHRAGDRALRRCPIRP